MFEFYNITIRVLNQDTLYLDSIRILKFTPVWIRIRAVDPSRFTRLHYKL